MKHTISRPFRRAQFYDGGSNASSSSLLQHLKWESHPRPSHHHSKTSFWLLLVWSQQSWLFIFYCVKKDTTKKLKIGRQRPTTLLCVFLVSLVGRTPSTTTIYCKTYDVWRVKKLKYVGNWKWYLDIFTHFHTFSIFSFLFVKKGLTTNIRCMGNSWETYWHWPGTFSDSVKFCLKNTKWHD